MNRDKFEATSENQDSASKKINKPATKN